MLDPDEIAKTYLQFHNQHKSAWAWEIELRPLGRNFLIKSTSSKFRADMNSLQALNVFCALLHPDPKPLSRAGGIGRYLKNA